MVWFFSNLYNLFSTFANISITTLIFFFIFTLFFFFFFKSNTSFFRGLILIFYIIFNGIFLSFYSLDFFSGFLMVGELPLSLICLLFIFQKNSIQVDDIYKFNKKNLYIFLFILIYVVSLAFFFTFIPTNINNLIYQYTIDDFIFTQVRSDLSVFFIIFYYFNVDFLVIVGFILFIVSFVVIFYFFLNNQLFFFNKVLQKNKIFLKNQSFLKQSIFPTFFTFFKKKK